MTTNTPSPFSFFGSTGKTTLATAVSAKLQKRVEEADPSAGLTSLALSMDGFHYTRKELSAMPDPEHAHARRGAAFTFNAEKFRDLIVNLSKPPSEVITAPTFDHAVKDPKEDDTRIPASARIIIIEGNYLALDEPVWREAAALLNEIWFVEVDFEVARKRLRERHVRAGIARNLEEGDKRALENDLVNGKEIVEKRLPLAEIIQSREDGSWIHE